jgi:hypothetical protein
MLLDRVRALQVPNPSPKDATRSVQLHLFNFHLQIVESFLTFLLEAIDPTSSFKAFFSQNELLSFEKTFGDSRIELATYG